MENEKQIMVNSDEQEEVTQPGEETLTVEELDEVSGGLKRGHFLTKRPSISIETDLRARQY